MSHNPNFDPRNPHSKSNADRSQQPRPPKRETEVRLLAHGEPSAPVQYSLAAMPASAASSQVRPMSVLSVNAPEFKPKVYQYQGGSSSQAQPSPALSAGAAEFVPRTADFVPLPMGVPPNVGPPLQMSVPPPFLPPGAAVEAPLINSFLQMNLNPGEEEQGHHIINPTEHLLEEFSHTMFILTTHPANVHDFLKPLCDKLQGTQNQNLLDGVISILYEQGIYVPNFRYTGARVVHFLSHELKNHSIFSLFKSHFLKRCQVDYSQREELIKSGEDGLVRLCGLTMFMGEIFLNVSADAQGQKERLSFLPKVLTDLLLTLLSQPSDTSIKTVCQLLKLAGGPTEDGMAQSPADIQNFNNVFTTLENLQSLLQLSKTSQLLMKSVLNLRSSNWGRVDNRPSISVESAQDTSHTPPSDFAQPDPVFYTLDGKPITRAEAGYQEEEDEEDYDGYELTEEEEKDFLIWQEESSGRGDHMGMGGPHPSASGRPPYAEGGMYPPWSTGEADTYFSSYPQGYDYPAYNHYIEDDGLNDEMEKAYEEFLDSQRRSQSGRR